MQKPGVPLNLEDLEGNPEKREILQMLHSLNRKRDELKTAQEKMEIKKQMLNIAREHDLIREALVLLKITPEEWRIIQAINAFVKEVY